jgi:hypothetical protein
MISLLVYLIVLVLVFGIVWWIISQIPLPPPMGMVVRVCFGLIALLVVLYFVGSAIGPPHIGRLD